MESVVAMPSATASCLSLAAGLLTAFGSFGSASLSSGSAASPVSGHAGFAPQHLQKPPPPDFQVGQTLTLSALVTRSDTIVGGEVLDLKSSWTVDRSDIFTTVVLRVDRRLKGSGRDLIRFRVPGGRVGEDWVHVTHAPRFELGERALVFLRSGGGRLSTVVGMEAGKRHLAVGDDGVERILPEFHGDGEGGRPGVALATMEEFAAALPRIEALAAGRRHD